MNEHFYYLELLWLLICVYVEVVLNESNLYYVLGYQNNLRVLYSSCKTPASSVKKTIRHIPQVPERILDAPDILDDYCK